MKNFKWIVAIVVYIAFAKANTIQAQQDFKAIAHFIVKSKFEMQGDQETDRESKAFQSNKKVKDALTNGTQHEFKMEFTATQSYYNEVQKLAKPLAAGDFSIQVKTYNGSTSEVYKNLQSRVFQKVDHIAGKDFIVSDTLRNPRWDLSQESKKIGNYTCYKATYKPDQNTETEKQPSNGLFEMIVEEDPTITAWYTPEIPISNGPGDHHGLPGMILEVHEQQTILLCTRININPIEELKIEKPRGGKKVSQQEFEEILQRRMSEDGHRRSNQAIFINKG